MIIQIVKNVYGYGAIVSRLLLRADRVNAAETKTRHIYHERVFALLQYVGVRFSLSTPYHFKPVWVLALWA
jgi:hypothetical protein